MNSQSPTSRFTNEVKEMVKDFMERTKALSAADVWNIQRRKKSRTQRRFAL